MSVSIRSTTSSPRLESNGWLAQLGVFLFDHESRSFNGIRERKETENPNIQPLEIDLSGYIRWMLC